MESGHGQDSSGALRATAPDNRVDSARPCNNDFAATALNILPSGQYGPSRRRRGRPQAQMYDTLTPLFDQVRTRPRPVLQVRGASGSPPTARHDRGRAARGVQIIRDSYNVPHVNAETYDGGIWAAGWIAAEDRGPAAAAGPLQRSRRRDRRPGRHRNRPDRNLENFPPSARPRPRSRSRPTAARRAGKEGQGCCTTSTPSSPASTTTSRQQPLDRAVDPQRRLRAQRAQGPVPRPGRRRRGPPLAVPRRAAAAARHAEGHERLQRPAPVQEPREPRPSIDGKFPYGHIPRRHGQRRARPRQLPGDAGRRRETVAERLRPSPTASNTLMIDARRTRRPGGR